MKVELLISEECPSCDKAVGVWRSVCDEQGVVFCPLDVYQPEGQALLNRWRLNTIPALIIDGELMAVGVQTREQAIELIAIAETE